MKRSEEDGIDFDGPRPGWAHEHREMEALGLSEGMAWSGEGAGVPLGAESSEEAMLRERGRVVMARRRVEG